MNPRLAILWNAGNPGIEVSVREMERAGSQSGVQIHAHGVRGTDDFRGVFEAVVREHASVLFVFDDVLVTAYKNQILDWAAKARLPVVSQYREFVDAGAPQWA